MMDNEETGSREIFHMGPQNNESDRRKRSVKENVGAKVAKVSDNRRNDGGHGDSGCEGKEQKEEAEIDEMLDVERRLNGFHSLPPGGTRSRRMFVHSHSVPKSSWRSWASRVASTTNIELVIRNISILHVVSSVLLVVMGIVGILASSYMSYLSITIWIPVLIFLPTSIGGLRSYRRLRDYHSIQTLAILSVLSTISSLILCIVYASFIFEDGRYEVQCHPAPSVVIAHCAQSIYRVFINALDVFLFIIELIASLSSVAVCCILKPGCSKQSSDSEQLLSMTSLSYKRLATDETVEFLEELHHSRAIGNNNSNGMYPRSISAPALVGGRVIY